MTDLPVDFFDTGTNNAKTDVAAFDYSAYEKREKQKKLAENKLYSIGVKTGNMQGNATVAGHIR